MSVNRGDVVLLNAPFVTRPGSKVRPMLVVQSDRNTAHIRNTILAAITTNVSRTHEPTQVFIDISTSAGRQTGLLANSDVSCENLLTVRKSQIIRTIGKLPPELLENVNKALKVSLDLSPDAND
jgi:mRNA interferase MazF